MDLWTYGPMDLGVDVSGFYVGFIFLVYHRRLRK